MKDREDYKCPKCDSNKFKLVYRTYEEEPNEDFHGEFLAVICSNCGGNFWSFEIDQKVFKHAEKAWLEEELGIKLKPKNIT